MKTLDLIRFIAQRHEEFETFVFEQDEISAMDCISELASIDPSHYDSIFWDINTSLEKGSLLIYRN